ncbi:MAG: two-component sensor histidine kinase [Lysobacterales bacterium 14-68-21]|jgi:two-component system sensor histidine kinase DesK|nr:MAG: two-component sensor histidine kinase [Xanthomonadales bacterium 15-68-25]OZB67945.1 MAG: two-component sensor histidine kinase [Xanthomonadales bacterium 14-68-21]
MRLAKLPAWLKPAPDSLVADSVARGKSPWTDAVHLLWTAWLFITPVFDHDAWNRHWLLLTALSYPVFLALYGMCCIASRRASRAYAGGMLVLCMVMLPWYPSGMTYFVFGCVMLRVCRMPFRTYMLTLSGLNVALLAEAWLLHYPWQATFTMPIVTFIIGLIINAERTSSEKDAELRLSHEEVRRLAANAERERIGRDLHDLLGHTLSLITLKLELSRKLFDRDSEAARREMSEAEAVARHALAEVRAAVTGIRATDLAAELASARLLLASSRVHLDYEIGVAALPEAVERHFALVIREASTNIVRHARASEARIRLHCDLGEVVLEICDNGRGGIAEDGNGLRGMRERVRTLGGQLVIDSPRGRGTHLTIRVRAPTAEPVASSHGEVSAAALTDAGRSAA